MEDERIAYGPWGDDGYEQERCAEGLCELMGPEPAGARDDPDSTDREKNQERGIGYRNQSPDQAEGEPASPGWAVSGAVADAAGAQRDDQCELKEKRGERCVPNPAHGVL